jgi:ABC-type nitrate/sulfonate/bicarbonate transport system substrate-binding protein
MPVWPQASTAPALTKVTLVGPTVNPPSVSNIFYLAAMEGYFQKNGLDVEVQQANGSPASIAAIVSGRSDFTFVNLVALASAAAEGVKAKLVACQNSIYPDMMISQPDIRSVHDLEGKVVGITALGATDDVVAKSYLSKQGVDANKINWVALREPHVVLQALISGQIVAAVVNGALTVDLLARDPKLKILVDAQPLTESAPITGAIVVVTETFAQSKPQIVQAMVNATIEALRDLYKDRSLFEKVVTKNFPGIYTPQQIIQLYDIYRPLWGVNGGLDFPVFDKVVADWKTSVDPTRAKNPYFSKAEDLVNESFARTALSKLGMMPDTSDKAGWYK